jgi:hypothetical protein
LERYNEAEHSKERRFEVVTLGNPDYCDYPARQNKGWSKDKDLETQSKN